MKSSHLRVQCCENWSGVKGCRCKKKWCQNVSCLLKNAWVEPAFPYALLPCHKKVKQNIIGVIRGANAKSAHHKGLVLTYPIENEMPLVYHVVSW